MKKIFTVVASAILTAIITTCMLPNSAFANSEFSVSPMNQKIILNPGETYNGSFDVTNPVSSTMPLEYFVTVEPFYVNDDYHVIFENNGDYNQIVNWIKIENEDGIIEPNHTETIRFEITVPADAPAGGQYASLTVGQNTESLMADNSLNIQNNISISHIIYAEVTGETRRTGEIVNLDVPGFLFSGNISASSTVKNNGNVHGVAKYTLQVFPLFSGEEIYTNEESPEEKTILPERELYSTSYWSNTPPIGIYNVIYSVEFEDMTAQISRMVIKCPIWLLFIIIFAVIALIIWIVLRTKNRGKRNAD